MQELTINNAGCDIHYWFRKGSGSKFLFFLHGAGAGHEMFEQQFPPCPKRITSSRGMPARMANR